MRFAMVIRADARNTAVRWRAAARTTRAAIPRALTAVEMLLTLPVLLASWWICAIYRSILAGWAISGLKSDEKKSVLSELIGP